ncbi:ParA family protein, partial [Acinetobacter baumannii]
MSALIIGVFNQKGGCGKTTTSVQLAGTLALRGIRTLLGDLDKQGTASVWSASAG